MATLHLICGPAGVGKSTYGRKLAAEIGACFLDSDTVTEPVVRAGMTLGKLDPEDRDSAAYRSVFRNPVYECLFAVAAENLPHLDVIIVGPFTSEIRDPSFPVQLAERCGGVVKVTFLTCDEALRRSRIEARGNPRDRSKLQDWQAYLAASDIRPPVFPHDCVVTS
jgi:predicted kinase